MIIKMAKKVFVNSVDQMGPFGVLQLDSQEIVEAYTAYTTARNVIYLTNQALGRGIEYPFLNTASSDHVNIFANEYSSTTSATVE
jgi:hypothetical protein